MAAAAAAAARTSEDLYRDARLAEERELRNALLDAYYVTVDINESEGSSWRVIYLIQGSRIHHVYHLAHPSRGMIKVSLNNLDFEVRDEDSGAVLKIKLVDGIATCLATEDHLYHAKVDRVSYLPQPGEPQPQPPAYDK